MAAIEVEIQDQFGNPFPDEVADVTVAIVANPGQAVLYANGESGCLTDCFLMRVDVATPAVIESFASTHQEREITAMTYDAASGMVFATDLQLNVSPNTHDLAEIDPVAGGHTVIGAAGILFKGLAFDPTAATPRLLGLSNFGCCGNTSPPDELYEINRATGAATLIGQVTVADDAIVGTNGLVVDPTDGTLYALLQLDGANRQIRTLATLNPATRVATVVDTLQVNGVASITFLPDGTLIAATGSGAATGQDWTIFSVDPSDGSMTQVISLGPLSLGGAVTWVPDALSGTLVVETVDGASRRRSRTSRSTRRGTDTR